MSLALDALPRLDWADVVILSLPDDAPVDLAVWAEEIFRVRSAPLWVKTLLAARQAVVALIGIRRAQSDIFTVREVRGEEALIVAEDRHLDFAVGVGVDPNRMLLRLTTAVQLHGWRGRLYFLPVRILHDPVTRAMIRRAVRNLTGR